MGLLDYLPGDLLEMIRNSWERNRANQSIEDANYPASQKQQQQRPPLSLAGPDLAANITASSPLPAHALQTSAARSEQQQILPAQNLTAQALRMKGVPEDDISAAAGNPKLLKQIIIQHFGPSSGSAPPWRRYAADYSSNISDRSGDARLDDDPNTNRFDDARMPPELVTPQPVQLKCDGWNGCQNGGSFGHGGMYSVLGQTLCQACAVKKLGGELLPSTEKTGLLRPYLIQGGK